ncbi:M4 family metallopeptidase [Streptomyces sp. NPDC051940]|uniref:M4 family metallopeptidase n=1 Tax=Streptomyces sp. NPDC051940 TaxID=3155675 RepID=UPI0034158FAF
MPAVAASGDAPAEAVAGTGTETPALVTGLDEAADASASPADAARGHLAAHKGRYHIADPAKDLTALGAESHGGQETVRLQQKYRGVEVLGGQYVVRMEKKDGKRTVTGTSGRYYTELDLDTVEPKVTADKAVERAIGAVVNQLGAGKLTRPGQEKNPLTGSEQGLVVLPQGAGVLTRHITVEGVSGPADGTPVKQEVYVDAHSGFPLLQYSGLQTFGATAGATGAATEDAATADEAGTTAVPGAVQGTGVRYNGQTATLNLYKGADGLYQMIDYSKRAPETPFSGPMLVTYDARGREASSASGAWPTGIKTFSNTTPDFGADATNAGAVDAHWGAGKVYDFYKNHFGRKSLDGKDGYMYSLVGVVSNGRPYNNAFWDGQKMVYGQGGGDFRTFSADTDVVGHEMTHGVVQHSANLVYVGQSGAMNEALADYFGNAIDVEANGLDMADPDTALLGEDLCTTAAPRDCALRDLDDGATTQDDFIGVTMRGDNGGVHLNSTIFSGALWDIRQALGGELADQYVYRALSAYMTPLDGFTDGRNAVVAAATELGATKAQLGVVEQAFDDHGIVDGWERRLGVDSDTLIDDVNIYSTGVGAGGGRYAVSRSSVSGDEPFSVWAGRTDGRGTAQLVSENNGDYNVYADTDGKTVVWAQYTSSGVRIMARPVDGGLAEQIGASGTEAWGLSVDGDIVVFTQVNPSNGTQHVTWINMATGKTGLVDNGSGQFNTALPSVKDGVVAYAKLYPELVNGSFQYRLGVETYDTATGVKTLMPGDGATAKAIGQTTISDDGVFWLRDENVADGGKTSLERAATDGSNPVTLLPETSDDPVYGFELTSSDDAVTITSVPAATWWANATLPKLFQIAPDGKGGPVRVSCNRGDQVYPAADDGRRVLWIDGTTGSTDLVTRPRPAGKC